MRKPTFTITTMTLAMSGLLGGCVVHLPGNLDVGDETTGDGDTGDGDTGDGDGDTGDGDTGDGDPPPGPPHDGDGCQPSLDILLIVDNSGSMGVQQAKVSESITALIGPLDAGGINWRLAVTTTDVGNPWCPAGSTMPAAGAYQLRSCKDHPQDFLFNNGEVDVTDSACNDICPYEPGEVFTLPTTTDVDPNAAPRPWIERIDGVSNLPAELDLISAARCVLPQGINGCGFEQPLEAAHLAVLRAQDPMAPEHGFMRDDASLLIVIVTDEVDCSHDKNHSEIFDQDGNRAFWSDPNASFPTSAVCWNAGVRCVGDPAGYDDCVAQDYDEDGDLAPPEDAVLHPISRYTDVLIALEQQKLAIDPGLDVGMLVISGLGTNGQLHYADVSNTDPAYQDSFGIGPGCEAVNELDPNNPARAVPPVRMREVGAALTGSPLVSICNDNFNPAFVQAYDRLFGECP